MLSGRSRPQGESILERTYESASALVATAAGPLSGHLPRFVDSLVVQQYVPAVVYVKALHAVAFDRWLARRHTVVADIAEAHIASFGRRRRRCRGSVRPETKKRERFDLVHLLRYLRTVGACSQAPHIDTPADDLGAAYERHLRHLQGLG